jgi:DNA-3-methyladenine glycosylase
VQSAKFEVQNAKFKLIVDNMTKKPRGSILDAKFFHRLTVDVAKDMIGCQIVRKVNGKTFRHTITETEAYDGPNDLACHGSKGRTKRTEVLFGPAGHLYVYFVYGMHWLLNVTAGPLDYPAGILIRGIDNIKGPARVAKALQVSGKMNGLSASKKSGLWFEAPQEKIKQNHIKKTTRVGVDYAGPIWAKKKWRFIIKSPKTI